MINPVTTGTEAMASARRPSGSGSSASSFSASERLGQQRQQHFRGSPVRLGKIDVKSDHRGARVAQLCQQFRDQAARPRPLADLRQARIVDVDNADRRVGGFAGGSALVEVEGRSARPPRSATPRAAADRWRRFDELRTVFASARSAPTGSGDHRRNRSGFPGGARLGVPSRNLSYAIPSRRSRRRPGWRRR